MALSELACPSRLVGLKQVKRGLSHKKVKKVFLAEDADPDIIEDVSDLARESGVPVEIVRSMLALGRACAIDRCAATAALQH